MRDPARTRRDALLFAVLTTALTVFTIAVLLQSDGPSDPPMPRIADVDEETAGDAAESTATASSEAPVESVAPDAGTATDPAATGAPASPERVPALVASVRDEGGAVMLTVDYIQFLTGTEAAAAAADRGDESPPPNDYYIVNDNARLREFRVQDGIAVMTVVRDDGGSDPGGHALPLADWVERLSGPTGDAFRSSFYWLTISGDTITTIEQQYLP